MITDRLAVHVSDGVTEVDVTREVQALSWRKVDNGGWASSDVELNLPLSTWTDPGPDTRVLVTDASDGEQAFGGYVEQPGRQADDSGERWKFTVLGGLSLASDESLPVIYADGGLEWERDELTSVPASASTNTSVNPDGSGVDGLLMQFVPGQPIGFGVSAQMSYRGFADAGMEFGAITVTTVCGKTDSGYRVQLAWTPPNGAGELMSADQILNVPRTNIRIAGAAGAVHPPDGVNRVALRLQRTGGPTNVADDTTYAFFSAITVIGRRVDRYGVRIPATDIGSAEHVLAHQVFEDLIGRFLPLVDPAYVNIEAPAVPWPITQLAHPDGITARGIADQLSVWEPGQTWGITELLPNGRHRAHYLRRSTDVRYEVEWDDPMDAPGGEADLCNQISVYWTDLAGRKQHERVTSVVPRLGSRRRDAESITLPDGTGSKEAAIRLGQAILAEKSTPPVASTVTVDRPILDRWTGNWVEPHKLEPGCLVRDVKNGRDIWCTEVAYDGGRHAAALTLGNPVQSTEQRLARLDARQ